MLIVGLALFGAGSPAAGLAESSGQLIAARAGMGVGGALLLTTTLAVVMQIFTPEEQPRAIGSPVMAHAVMSSIPREKAGVGAGINGTLAEFGHGLRVAVLGAVLNARFAALVPVAASSLPAALAAADSEGERGRITDAFSSGLETSPLVEAPAVLLGGLVAAALLHRAGRADSGEKS